MPTEDDHHRSAKTDHQASLFHSEDESERATGSKSPKHVTTDRTLLAHLGFADPDKKNPIHDLACRYVMENAMTVARMTLDDPFWTPCKVDVGHERVISRGGGFVTGFVDVFLKTSWSAPSTLCDEHFLWGSSAAIVEVKIARVSIGDAIRQLNLYAVKMEREIVAEFQASISHANCSYCHQRHADRSVRRRENFAMKMRTFEDEMAQFKKSDAGKFLPSWGPTRPVLQDPDYDPEEEWKEEFNEAAADLMVKKSVLVTAYDLTRFEKDLLNTSNIIHFRLGDRFDQWLKSNGPVQSNEL